MSEKPISNNRTPSVEVDAMFPDRWSPRAFDASKPIDKATLHTLFEAARWAPSCFNDQPWLFFYAHEESDRKAFLSTLVEGNQMWAKSAPVLVYIASRKHFLSNPEKANAWSTFDTGAAWMAFALQARKLGLYTHAMAGFQVEKAHALLELPQERYAIHAAVALGHRAKPSQLPETLAEKEKPSPRQALVDFVFEAKFG